MAEISLKAPFFHFGHRNCFGKVWDHLMHLLQLRPSILRAFHVQCVGNVATLKPWLKVCWVWSSGFTIFWFCQCSFEYSGSPDLCFLLVTSLLVVSLVVSSLKFTFTVLAYMKRVLKASDCLPGRDSHACSALLPLLVLRRSPFLIILSFLWSKP